MVHVNVQNLEAIETAHGGGIKRVFLAQGLIPKITQIALVTLNKSTQQHSHPTMWECYYVLSGFATYVIDGKEVHVKPEDFIAIPPGVPHCQIVNHPHSVFIFGIATD